MVTELVLAVVLWTSPVALAAGYYTAGYHLRQIATNGAEGRYPGYIQRATEAYREQNPHRFADDRWDDE